jgi:hypothetical protein
MCLFFSPEEFSLYKWAVWLFGGARFRKFGPCFIGDDAREVDQCQNGIGFGDFFFRTNRCFSEALRAFVRIALLFTSRSHFP